MELKETLKDLDKTPWSALPRPATREEMPVLDLRKAESEAGIEQLGRELRSACLGMGFAYLANHGIPSSLTDSVFEASRRFFAQPDAAKAQVKRDPFHRGHVAAGLNQHPGYKADSKEHYEFARDLPLDHPDVLAGLPMHGPNLWPADGDWLKDACEQYLAAVLDVGQRLLPVFAASLGLERDFFAQHFREPMVIARLLYYPPQPPLSPEDAFGLAPHTDYGAITLLAQDPLGGLELKTRSGEWVSAPHIEDTLVMNLGDLFRAWTNDLYVSNPHRVVNRTGRERYSIPVFFNPAFRSVISCIPTCRSEVNPPRYEPVTAGEYFIARTQRVLKDANAYV